MSISRLLPARVVGAPPPTDVEDEGNLAVPRSATRHWRHTSSNTGPVNVERWSAAIRRATSSARPA